MSHSVLSLNALPRGGRLLVVGDIHGQLDMLDRVLARIGFDGNRDVLLCLGDMIDRGPDSYATLLAFVGPNRRPGFYSLLGNHEAMLVNRLLAVHPAAVQQHQRNGGEWADALLGDLAPLIMELKTLPLCATCVAENGRRIGAVHAELAPDRAWSELEAARADGRANLNFWGEAVPASALWGRRRIKLLSRLDEAKRGVTVSDAVLCEAVADNFRVPGLDLLIAGHTILPGRLPVRCGNHLWIDTGACLPEEGGCLTVVDPAVGVYWQASSNDSWGPSLLPGDQLLAGL